MDAEKKPRYHALDALRGLSLLLMIGHHLAIDLVMYELAPAWLLDNLVLDVFQPIFAACFVALSGASSRFSSGNVRRGVRILLAALAVTAATAAATWAMGGQTGADVTVYFGILHFLGLAALLYHLLGPALGRLAVPGPVWLGLFVLARLVFPLRLDVPVWLAPFGLMPPGFHSADYYPLLPWFFAYLFGLWIADCARQNRFPQGFYAFRQPFLEAVSRKSLWVYLLHQPILMALFQLYFALA